MTPAMKQLAENSYFVRGGAETTIIAAKTLASARAKAAMWAKANRVKDQPLIVKRVYRKDATE